MEKGIEYGYVRVSSEEQNVRRQIIAMLNVGIKKENIYIDKQTGKDFHRIPSSCRLRIFSLSFSATKDNICKTKSAINVPIKSLFILTSRQEKTFIEKIMRKCCLCCKPEIYYT